MDVDLDGVFDEEQFDSPLAFEARPVADHSEPAGDKQSPPKLTDPRPIPRASDRTSDAEPIQRAAETTPPANELGDDDHADNDDADNEDADDDHADNDHAENGSAESDDDEDLAPPALVREESPPRVRDNGQRDSGPMRAPRESAPIRSRDSSLSLRDAPPRKPVRREVTIRQASPLPVAKPAWRDEIVFWTYEVFDGVVERGAPIASPLDDLAGRFAVPDTVLPALVVLYGAHLAGERGVAPVHIARVLGSWDEALGRGLLAGRGLATFADSRVRLAGPIQRMLDEVPVETGALVGVPGTIALPGPHAVIAKAETPLKMVAVRWLGDVGGAILAAHDDADLAELFVEARARGAAPMFRIGADELLELGTDPAILVVTDEEVAESLGVPRLG